MWYTTNRNSVGSVENMVVTVVEESECKEMSRHSGYIYIYNRGETSQMGDVRHSEQSKLINMSEQCQESDAVHPSRRKKWGIYIERELHNVVYLIRCMYMLTA